MEEPQTAPQENVPETSLPAKTPPLVPENHHATSATQPESQLVMTAETGNAQPGVHVRSKKTLFRLALAMAILNPVFCGLLIGIYFWREPELKSEGKIVTAVALVWGVLVIALALANR